MATVWAGVFIWMWQMRHTWLGDSDPGCQTVAIWRSRRARPKVESPCHPAEPATPARPPHTRPPVLVCQLARRRGAKIRRARLHGWNRTGHFIYVGVADPGETGGGPRPRTIRPLEE
jgi:hypothetical protein